MYDQNISRTTVQASGQLSYTQLNNFWSHFKMVATTFQHNSFRFELNHVAVTQSLTLLSVTSRDAV